MAEGSSYADCEPLFPDTRLARTEELIRKRYTSLPPETVFATAIVDPPAGNATEAHFILNTPSPHGYADVRTVAQVLLSEWFKEEISRSHFVSNGEPLEVFIFDQMAFEHRRRLNILRSMN